MAPHSQAENIMRKSDQFSEEDRVIVPDKVDLTKLNGVPEEHQSGRRVRIYVPAKSVMQSGTNGCRLWQLEFDNRERWENPLMGWASSGDPLSCTTVEFETSEAAVEFCQRQGWPCYVDTPNLPKMTVRSYGANFSWNKHTRVGTK
ncbi:NADH dehydrogenase (ubiquinone) Fe-S protein 4 [Paragonimus westermani]|uniref:NADH dehydrogenase [ubiquinone] iron-sulfur protein 4, mitochondrial n=1 Tax=Paragonimus westermani TaxID=34504 RepID=A0A5J4NIQ0_9TREM|nr:NADH dehydrogenase (ubiquinone) Fe-S protein 4 [Paragonimus westermani]